MDFSQLIISFVVMLIVMIGITILAIRWFLFSSTESAKKRLDKDIQKAHERQIELGRKLKDADEDLESRRREANELSNRVQSEIEGSAKEEKEKIIHDARSEGETIIVKAQEATEKMRLELEKEMDIRAVEFSMEILTKILTDKARGELNHILVKDFIEDLRNTDMSNINPDIKNADVISLSPVDSKAEAEITGIITEKVGHDISVAFSTDPDIGGGVIVKFGSLALDGSIKNLIREEGIFLKTQLDTRAV